MKAPERLGPYTIRRAIGRGGMGVVYEGVDDATGHVAAVKLLAADMAHRGDFRDRFEAEIESLRKLNHPNIVRIFGFGHEDDQLFYSMEYVAGSSMEEQLSRGRLFDWRETLRIGIDLARALRHAHDRGVIHRDIKPGNLLMSTEGAVKLSDFGIARLFGNNRLTSVGSVLGTAEFMSPEQAEGKPVDPRSDLYSLGAVMYVMLARRSLFEAKSFIEMLEKQRSALPTPLHHWTPDVPQAFERIIHRLLEKDPERRYATAMALVRRLEDFEETQNDSEASLLATPSLPTPENQSENPAEQTNNGTQSDESSSFLLSMPQKGMRLGDETSKQEKPVDVSPMQAAAEKNAPNEPLRIDQFAETRLATRANDHRQTAGHLADDIAADVPAGGRELAQDRAKAAENVVHEVANQPFLAKQKAGTARYQATERLGNAAEPAAEPKDQPRLSLKAAKLPDTGRLAAAERPIELPAPTFKQSRGGSFITVTPGEHEKETLRTSHAGPIAWQVALLAGGLLVVGLASWHFAQPLSADALYKNVETSTAGQSEDSLLSAEDQVDQFLARFPSDRRSVHLRDLQNQIDMLHRERRLNLVAKGVGPRPSLLPAERSYLDALALSRTDPEAGAAQLQAIIDLYSSGDDMRGPASNTSPTAQCIELARRRLLQLTEQNNKQQAEVLAEVQQRLDHADAIRPNDPKQAASIYRAAIELYGHRRWADPIVHRAQQALDQLKTDSHPSVNASQ